ncbi:MAG: FliH/SctL family protein [Vicinamibacterales bacterium]
MSPSAARLAASVPCDRFEWPRPDMLSADGRPVPMPHRVPVVTDPGGTLRSVDLRDAPLPNVIAERVATAERDAYARGRAEGEAAGEAAATRRLDATIQRLVQTIDQIAALRAGMVRRTEQEIVRLSLAIAERVIHREVTVDRALLVGMARVAIDRLGDEAAATIHLHPADHERVMHGREELEPGGAVRVVADPQVEPGGCLVRSSFGRIDLAVDSQVREVSRALLGGEAGEESHGEPDQA